MSSIDSKNQTITQTAKSQAALSPVSSVELLKKGNECVEKVIVN